MTPLELRLRAELRAERELNARLTELLAIAQENNETAYRAARNAMCEPHLCSDLPFGSKPAPAEEPLPALAKAKAAPSRETDPIRRVAWRQARRNRDEEDTH